MFLYREAIGFLLDHCEEEKEGTGGGGYIKPTSFKEEEEGTCTGGREGGYIKPTYFEEEEKGTGGRRYNKIKW